MKRLRSRGPRPLAAIWGLAALAFLGIDAPATAGTVGVEGPALIFNGAGAGENLSVDKGYGELGGLAWTVVDSKPGNGAITSSLPCKGHPRNPRQAECPSDSSSIRVKLAGGSDFFRTLDYTTSRGCEQVQNAAAVEVNGGPGADIIDGSNRADIIDGSAQGDVIDGYGGADRITGGSGRDMLYGRAGDDIVSGDSGNDKIHPDKGFSYNPCHPQTGGDDVANGGSGHDLIWADEGDDRLRGNSGNDFLIGGAGRDTLLGGPGRDKIRSRDGRRDVVNCGSGRDAVLADRGDRLIGCERQPRFL